MMPAVFYMMLRLPWHFWATEGIDLSASPRVLGRFSQLPRSQAFLVGFSASAPWYMTMLGVSGVLSVYSARAERAGKKTSFVEAHPACDARQIWRFGVRFYRDLHDFTMIIMILY